MQKALALDPNDSACHRAMSWALSMAGRPAEGLVYAKSGMRLDPLNPALHKIGDDMFIGFESLDGGGLVVLHQATVTSHVGAEDGGELAVKAFLFHATPH
jgi:hypothetical protein